MGGGKGLRKRGRLGRCAPEGVGRDDCLAPAASVFTVKA